MSDYLFVYGTLRRNGENGVNRLLAPYADFVGAAVYQGRLYRVDDYPGAVPSDRPQDRVYGEVYRLRCPDTALARLDEYEECGPAFPAPAEYLRRKQRVTLKSGEAVAAWVYIYNRPTARLQPIPSGEFSPAVYKAAPTPC